MTKIAITAFAVAAISAILLTGPAEAHFKGVAVAHHVSGKIYVVPVQTDIKQAQDDAITLCNNENYSDCVSLGTMWLDPPLP